ncbi:hypothetical protein ASD74_20165 [Rhizobium sp. Root564]|nr:hypothetical protein ASD74_20165 [Rhizobium sp. Root564]
MSSTVMATVSAILILIAVVIVTLVPPLSAVLVPTIAVDWIGRCTPRLAASRGDSHHVREGSLNDLVEFTLIQPNASTAWAVVNLDALPFTHEKTGLTTRAGHLLRTHLSHFELRIMKLKNLTTSTS